MPTQTKKPKTTTKTNKTTKLTKFAKKKTKAVALKKKGKNIKTMPGGELISRPGRRVVASKSERCRFFLCFVFFDFLSFCFQLNFFFTRIFGF